VSRSKIRTVIRCFITSSLYTAPSKFLYESAAFRHGGMKRARVKYNEPERFFLHSLYFISQNVRGGVDSSLWQFIVITCAQRDARRPRGARREARVNLHGTKTTNVQLAFQRWFDARCIIRVGGRLKNYAPRPDGKVNWDRRDNSIARRFELP